ncbi:MAG: hypothetical protein HYW23_02360 [Candidatus Aenigmarchaeota archaeon]|nr:hypothetical protein [Candidatus Aenigmarchaeota archaeon]
MFAVFTVVTPKSLGLTELITPLASETGTGTETGVTVIVVCVGPVVVVVVVAAGVVVGVVVVADDVVVVVDDEDDELLLVVVVVVEGAALAVAVDAPPVLGAVPIVTEDSPIGAAITEETTKKYITKNIGKVLFPFTN